jgi:L-ascorbate metabolism protein UlaG (beta-lactamase superfamily)
MKVSWIGHACLLIEAEEGRILTDPFGKDVPYNFPDLAADIVTVSHNHSDHNAATGPRPPDCRQRAGRAHGTRHRVSRNPRCP